MTKAIINIEGLLQNKYASNDPSKHSVLMLLQRTLLEPLTQFVLVLKFEHWAQKLHDFHSSQFLKALDRTMSYKCASL